MKILSINSSPRGGGQSKTELMLNHLVQGMLDAGGEVEVVNLRRKKIKNCIGCFTCWTKTPGTCIHKDDMTNEIFPKLLASDLVVYATPLYYHFMNGAMIGRINENISRDNGEDQATSCRSSGLCTNGQYFLENLHRRRRDAKRIQGKKYGSATGHY